MATCNPFSYSPALHGSLEDFCSSHSPSKIFAQSSRPDWLWVHDKSGFWVQQCQPGAHERATARGEQLLKDFHNSGAKDPDGTMARLHSIAVEECFTAGKWMLISPASRVDQDWSIICKGTASGSLGSCTAKVGISQRSSSSFVICIYVSDFSNASLVKLVLNNLCTSGLPIPSRGIYFKSDIATVCNVYSATTPGLQPTLYRGTRPSPGQSKIEAVKNSQAASIYLSELSAIQVATENASVQTLTVNKGRTQKRKFEQEDTAEVGMPAEHHAAGSQVCDMRLGLDQ